MTTRGQIRNPQDFPVIEIDAHLPAVPAQRLSSAALRARFAAAPEWTPEHAGDGRVLIERAPKPAAVLMAMVERGAGLSVLLTRRTAHLRDHAGQVSFPGGRSDEGDADAIATALREAREEVGLHASHVEVIGTLPAYTTVTAYEVTPVAALVRPGFACAPDPFEVAEVFEVPLAYLMDPAHHRRHRAEFDGLTRHFLSIPWRGPGLDGVERDYFIWGATAAMLRNLYRFLSV